MLEDIRSRLGISGRNSSRSSCKIGNAHNSEGPGEALARSSKLLVWSALAEEVWCILGPGLLTASASKSEQTSPSVSQPPSNLQLTLLHIKDNNDLPTSALATLIQMLFDQ